MLTHFERFMDADLRAIVLSYLNDTPIVSKARKTWTERKTNGVR